MIEIQKGVWRGAAPDIESLKKQGIFSVLSLETYTRELIFGNPNREMLDCFNAGITYFNLELSGIFPPRKEDIALALRILILDELRPIYFHCRAGLERTGFLAAVYRMQYQGWTFDAAYAEWKQMGCRWPTYWLWKSALKKWERK